MIESPIQATNAAPSAAAAHPSRVEAGRAQATSAQATTAAAVPTNGIEPSAGPPPKKRAAKETPPAAARVGAWRPSIARDASIAPLLGRGHLQTPYTAHTGGSLASGRLAGPGDRK